jgi:hypothetical protein
MPVICIVMATPSAADAAGIADRRVTGQRLLRRRTRQHRCASTGIPLPGRYRRSGKEAGEKDWRTGQGYIDTLATSSSTVGIAEPSTGIAEIASIGDGTVTSTAPVFYSHPGPVTRPRKALSVR